jgi:homoserine dehydrogenase
MNAVLVKGDAVGATLYYGAGAGAEPTGSAVVADVIDVVRALTSDPENRVPHLAFQPNAIVDIPVLAAEDIKTAYYLRLNAEDKPGVLADVTKILADQNISIEAIIQKEPLKGETSLPIIMLTQQTLEKEMNAAIAKMEALSTIIGKVTRIRMETLG